MSEKNKYDSLLEELSSLEKQVYIYVQRNQELNKSINQLTNKNRVLQQENELLKLKLEEKEIMSQSAEAEKNRFPG